MHKKVKNYIFAAAVTTFLGLAAVAQVVTYGDVSGEKESLNDLKNQRTNVEDILFLESGRIYQRDYFL